MNNKFLHSILLNFLMIAFLGLGTVTYANICIPDKGNLLKVDGVALGDTLNVREGYTTKFRVLFELDPDAINILFKDVAYKSDDCLLLCKNFLQGAESLKPIIEKNCRNKSKIWYFVENASGQSGWASGKYLKEVSIKNNSNTQPPSAKLSKEIEVNKSRDTVYDEKTSKQVDASNNTLEQEPITKRPSGKALEEKTSQTEIQSKKTFEYNDFWISPFSETSRDKFTSHQKILENEKIKHTEWGLWLSKFPVETFEIDIVPELAKHRHTLRHMRMVAEYPKNSVERQERTAIKKIANRAAGLSGAITCDVKGKPQKMNVPKILYWGKLNFDESCRMQFGDVDRADFQIWKGPQIEVNGLDCLYSNGYCYLQWVYTNPQTGNEEFLQRKILIGRPNSYDFLDGDLLMIDGYVSYGTCYLLWDRGCDLYIHVSEPWVLENDKINKMYWKPFELHFSKINKIEKTLEQPTKFLGKYDMPDRLGSDLSSVWQIIIQFTDFLGAYPQDFPEHRKFMERHKTLELPSMRYWYDRNKHFESAELVPYGYIGFVYQDSTVNNESGSMPALRASYGIIDGSIFSEDQKKRLKYIEKVVSKSDVAVYCYKILDRDHQPDTLWNVIDSSPTPNLSSYERNEIFSYKRLDAMNIIPQPERNEELEAKCEDFYTGINSRSEKNYYEYFLKFD